VGGNGYIDAVTTAMGTAPAISSGISQTKYLNKKWTLTSSGISGYSSYNATYYFDAADVMNSASPLSFVARSYASSSWSVAAVGTRTTTSTQVTGSTVFAETFIGEPSPQTVSSQPLSGTICYNTGTTLTTASSATPTPVAQWQRSADGGVSWVDITSSSLDAGVSYNTLTVGTLTIGNAMPAVTGYQYRMKYENINGVYYSDVATLTVNPQLSAITCKTDDPCQTGSAEVTVQISGGTSPFTVTATGSYTAPHPSPGASVNISSGTKTGVTTSTTFSGLPGNASYIFTVTDSNNCNPSN